jgi:hypothetical protein
MLGSDKSHGYCTTTVRAVVWIKFPEVAVTVAVYVPAGVPELPALPLPPPQAACEAKPPTSTLAHKTAKSFFFRDRPDSKTTPNANPEIVSHSA